MPSLKNSVRPSIRTATAYMMHEHAQFDDGGVSVEAGLMEMADRMRGGRWKVFKGQNDSWFEEYRLYHRDRTVALWRKAMTRFQQVDMV